MNNLSECYVVLGHLMNKDGSLKEESKIRVTKLINLLKHKENQIIFFCGWDYRSDSTIKIGNALKNFFIQHSNQRHDLYVSDLSRDTVGDAILLKHMFQEVIKDKSLHIITSDYHSKRAEKIFNFVFYDTNKIFMHPAITNSKNNRKAEEEKSFQAFKGTFANILAGDFKKILNRLISSHPYYNGEIHSNILIK